MNTNLQDVSLPATATNSINSLPLDILDAVAAEFQAWRNNKKSRSEKIPDELLNKAKALAGEFKPSILQKRLNLSSAQLNPNKPKSTASASSQHSKKPAPSTDQFIQLPNPVVTHQPQHINTGLSVDIITAQGVRISVSGLIQQDPSVLLSQLLGDAPC